MVDPSPEEPNYAKQSRTALRGLLFIAVIAALYVARDFLLPVVLASFIALTFRPAVRFLSRHYIPPWLSATLLVIILVGGGLSAGYMLSWQVSSWIDQAPQLAEAFVEKFRGLRSWLDVVVNLTDKIQDATTTPGVTPAQEVVVREPALPGWLVVMTWYPLQVTITLMATLVIAVFLMASGDLFYEKLVRVLPTLTDRKRALRIVMNSKPRFPPIF